MNYPIVHINHLIVCFTKTLIAVAFLQAARKSLTKRLISSFKFVQTNKLQRKFTVPRAIHAKIRQRLFTVTTHIRALEGAQSRGKADDDSAVCQIESRNVHA